MIDRLGLMGAYVVVRMGVGDSVTLSPLCPVSDRLSVPQWPSTQHSRVKCAASPGFVPPPQSIVDVGLEELPYCGGCSGTGPSSVDK